MALPPGFLDELRTRTSIAQVVGRKVTWDSRKSTPGKGDYWAPCPFHQEKTASFHVDDAKGFYYCFGCHAKGDALSFVRETENMGFMEAVTLLAGEVGLTVPAQDPAAAAKAAKSASLAEVMEMAVQFCRLNLKTAGAQVARDYLDGRGLTAETLTTFEIGFAPDSRTALTQHLRDKDVPEADIVAAGLAIKPDDGGAPYDRFRGRIMFPIRDARGRAIAFGGRAMDPNARAKYLNSPETPLFDKGRALYNIGPARAAAGKAESLIVAEGYMDVIALHQAGFAHAVAPLGTAVTQDQVRMMWRIAPEPVIALDGDTAGLRAAHRLIDNALPLLEAGKALRFCLMPGGKDPDDLIREQGPTAMADALDGALPMVQLLWQRETEGRVFDSPERRAGLDATFRRLLGLIEDPVVRGHYRDAIRDLRAGLFRPANAPAPGGFAPFAPRTGPGGGGGRGAGKGGRWTPPAMPTPSARASALAGGDIPPEIAEMAAARVVESTILLGCLNHPQVADSIAPELEAVSFSCPDLDNMRRALLQVVEAGLYGQEERSSEALCAALTDALSIDPRAALTQVGQVRANPLLAASTAPKTVEAAVRAELVRHRARHGMRTERDEAEQDIASGAADEGLTWRLQQAGLARDRSDREGLSDGADATDETARLSGELQRMLDAKIWLKKKP